jgi:catechol 2,3-dioxygenase-like lactoylglutathione lyase family enzyme
MRGAMLFVAGLSAGLAIQVSSAQTGAAGVAMMNHVAINVPSIPDAVAYYGDKMGYKEAFRVADDKGQPTIVYLHISQNTFLELNQAGPQRQPGFSHYGLQVDNAAAAVDVFKQRGVTVTGTNVSAGTKSILANITDPYMGRIELVEITPDSLHRKAIQSWK